MSTELIQLQDGLLVEVQSNPEDTPRQIAASAAELAEGISLPTSSARQ